MNFGVVSSGSPPLISPPSGAPKVTLSESKNPEEWAGTVLETRHGWEIRASDLAVDSLTGKTHVRLRSLTDRLLSLAQSQGWDGLHHIGLENVLVTAVACAEGDLPFVFSFDLGEAEGSIFGNQGAVAAALRACQAFTVPCARDRQTVERLFSSEQKGHVVPPVVTVGKGEPAEQVPSKIGAWGIHGRESGLPTVLKLAPSAERELLLLGSYEPGEMYEFSTLLDHHPFSEKVERPGGLSELDCLSRLLECERAVFPLQTSAQALYPLKALLVGARVLVSGVSLMHDVKGLHTVSREWEARLNSDWVAPQPGWHEPFSPKSVQSRWEQVYSSCL